jgi:ligand-binding SRPBCC domain-containing protein
MLYDPGRWRPLPAPQRLEMYARAVVIRRPQAEVFTFSMTIRSFLKLIPMRLVPDPNITIPDFRDGHVYPGEFRPVPFVRIPFVAHILDVVQSHTWVDVQLKGPLRYLRHTHIFEPTTTGTLCVDVLQYATPYGRLLDRTLVRMMFAWLIAYRHRKMKQLLEDSA